MMWMFKKRSTVNRCLYNGWIRANQVQEIRWSNLFLKSEILVIDIEKDMLAVNVCVAWIC